MPPSRPSLSGGANMPANQVMGTPGLIKQPPFEFDEGGMGLLSKRKLEELVKQIDPEEKLDPDVEEVCTLQLYAGGKTRCYDHHHYIISVC
jgi:transcription initiation factor TFIID subunit 12